jgi:hypothetical protein
MRIRYDLRYELFIKSEIVEIYLQSLGLYRCSNLWELKPKMSLFPSRIGIIVRLERDLDTQLLAL